MRAFPATDPAIASRSRRPLLAARMEQSPLVFRERLWPLWRARIDLAGPGRPLCSLRFPARRRLGPAFVYLGPPPAASSSHWWLSGRSSSHECCGSDCGGPASIWPGPGGAGGIRAGMHLVACGPTPCTVACSVCLTDARGLIGMRRACLQAQGRV